jgi:hypothetical protein
MSRPKMIIYDGNVKLQETEVLERCLTHIFSDASVDCRCHQTRALIAGGERAGLRASCVKVEVRCHCGRLARDFEVYEKTTIRQLPGGAYFEARSSSSSTM